MAPPLGASTASIERAASASTVSELNLSAKSGALDRTGANSSGQVLTTNQGVAIGGLMIDRMVAADGGNPDPSTTHGKHLEQAKRIEEKGWDYPKHVAGRAYGVVVHGDVAGVEVHRRNLTDWLDWMGLIDAGAAARLDRYIGYYGLYCDSHEALDEDKAVQEETRNVARAVVQAVKQLRAGALKQPDRTIKWPRTK